MEQRVTIPKDGSYQCNLWQRHLDGMNALVHWLTGFEAGGHGAVPGHFELTMHLRSLKPKCCATETEGTE